MTTVSLCSHPFNDCTTNWSNFWVNSDNEVLENKPPRWVRSSLWCCWGAQSILWSPSSLAIDLMYLFVNFPDSLLRIIFAEHVLDRKTWVIPNMFVLKQLPYLPQLDYKISEGHSTQNATDHWSSENSMNGSSGNISEHAYRRRRDWTKW